MASIDSLPADQRAVLQLVLQRGRSYDDIAQMLSIDRAAVRERALAGFDALGPGTRIAPERRALITDYMLGQLPRRVADDTHSRLAKSAAERAWARVVASEIGALASGPLPEIPIEGAAEEPVYEQAPEPDYEYEPEGADEPEYADAEFDEAPTRAAEEPIAAAAGARTRPVRARRPPRAPRGARAREPEPAAAAEARPSSRRGGAILLVGGAVLAVVVVVAIIAIASSGGSTTKSSSTTPASASTSTPSTASQTSSTGTTTPRPIAQVNLSSPLTGSKTKGAAVIVKQGTTTAIEIVAQGVPPNTAHDAYAVWLYNSPADSHLLGFVNPGIKKDGVLRTLGPLPTDASHFKQLLVTRETQAKPHGPGTIVLQGALNLPAA